MRRSIIIGSAAVAALGAATLASPAAAIGEAGNFFGHVHVIASVDDGSSPEGFEYEATSPNCALDERTTAFSDAEGLARFTDLPYYADDGSVCAIDIAALPREGYEVDIDRAQLTGLAPGTASGGPIDVWGAARTSWEGEMDGTGLSAEGELREDGRLDDSGVPEEVALLVHDDAEAVQADRGGSLEVAVGLTDRILSEQLGRTDVIEVTVDESPDGVDDPADCAFPDAGALNAPGACADRISLAGGADVLGKLSSRTVRIQTALGEPEPGGGCTDPIASVYVAEGASKTLCAEVDVSGSGAPAPTEVRVANAIDEAEPTDPPDEPTDPSDEPTEPPAEPSDPPEEQSDGGATDGGDDGSGDGEVASDGLAATGAALPAVPIAVAGGMIVVGGVLLLARRRAK